MPNDIENLVADSEIKEQGGNMQAALESAQLALEKAQLMNDVPCIRLAQVQYARLLAQVGKYQEAQKHSEDIRAYAEENSNTVEALIVLGICAYETDNLNGAEEYLHQAADLARKIDYKTGFARGLYTLAGSVYLIRGQFDLALSAINEASQQNVEDKYHNWAIHFWRAWIYQIIGDRQRFHRSLDELVPLVKPATPIAGNYYMLWARFSMDEDQLAKAEEYLRLALRIANTIGEPDMNIRVRLDYSRYYRLKGDPAVALTWAEDGIKFAQRTGNHYLYGLALIDYAQSAWQANDLALAQERLLEAGQVLSEFNAVYDQARAMFLLTALYQQRQSKKADQTWIEAANLIVKGGYGFILEHERSLAFPLVAGFLKSRNGEARAKAESLLQTLSRVAPPPLKIMGLGQFTAWQGRRLIPDNAWQRRKAGDLFRFLLLKPNHAANKEEIIENLWPDHEPATSQDLFHQATSTLRRVLEPDIPDKFPSRYLSLEGDRVILYLPNGSQVDFEQFERNVPASMQSRNFDKLADILSSYKGELFPQDRYSPWVISRQESIAELYRRSLIELGNNYLGKNQFYEALECSRRIMQQDSWNEDGVMLGMQACVGLRDIPRALRLYMDLEKTLNSELKIAPRDDLRTFAMQLTKG